MARTIYPLIKRIDDKLLLVALSYSKRGPFYLVPSKYQCLITYHREFLRKCPRFDTIIENGRRLLCLHLNPILQMKYTDKKGNLLVEGQQLEQEDEESSILDSSHFLSKIEDLNASTNNIHESTNIHDKLSQYESKIGKFQLFGCESIDQFLFKVELTIQNGLNSIAIDHFYHFLPRELLNWYYSLIEENAITDYNQFKRLFKEECLNVELKEIKKCKLDFVEFCKSRAKEETNLISEINRAPISFFVNEKIKLYEKVYKIKSARSIALSGLPDECQKRIRMKLNADDLSFAEYLKFEDVKYLKKNLKKD